MTATLTIKCPKGWFAAGEGMDRAIALLSDGAFKLFVYICLHARRDSGALEVVQAQLAIALRRSRGAIYRHLKELQAAGVCEVRGYHSPRSATSIEVTPDFWPYERATDSLPEEALQQVAEVRRLFLARPCVRAAFSPADERLARSWLQQGISLEMINRAILFGCARKYTAWRNGQERGTIGSLRYFEAVLEELIAQTPSPDYWQYVEAKVERLESLWTAAHKTRNLTSPGLTTEANSPGRTQADCVKNETTSTNTN
jgi:hypothetical protein